MNKRIEQQFVAEEGHPAVVPGSRVIRSAEIAYVGGRSVPHGKSPAIKLVYENDIVRAIDVTCECGQTVRLWCSYEAGGNSS